MKTLIILILLICSSSTLSKQKYYKWVDADGNIHYSQSKPENRKTSELNILTGKSQVAVKNTVDESDESQEKTAEQLASEVKNKELQEQNRKIKIAQDRLNCETAKKNFQTVQNTVRVRKKDPATGEYYRMGNEERNALFKQSRDNIKKFCK